MTTKNVFVVQHTSFPCEDWETLGLAKTPRGLAIHLKELQEYIWPHGRFNGQSGTYRIMYHDEEVGLSPLPHPYRGKKWAEYEQLIEWIASWHDLAEKEA